MAERPDRLGGGAVKRDEEPAEVATSEARPFPPREKEATEQGGGQTVLLQEDDKESTSFVSLEVTLSAMMEMLSAYAVKKTQG